MQVEKLLAYFGVDVDDASVKNALGTFSMIEGKAKDMVGKIEGAFAALSGGVVALMVNNYASAADATNKLGRRIGATAEELQEYDYVAQRSGVTTDLMRNSLEKLQGKVSDAANGNKDMTATLKELGIEAKSFSKMPIGDQMEAIAKGFQALKSDGDRTRLAMKLFEEEGRGMVTVFEGGADAIAKMRAEARALGVYTTQDAVRAEEYNDRLLDLKMAFAGIKNLIGAELVPVLTDLFVSMKEFFVANREVIASGIVTFFNSLGVAIKLASVALAVLVSYKVGVWAMAARAAIMSVVSSLTAMRVAMIASAATGRAFTVAMIAGLVRLRVAALAAAAAQVAMTYAIPVAIGAAIAAVVLIIEDIISYFRGDKSVTGLIVDEWGRAWDYCDQVITDTVKSMKASLSEFFSNLIPVDDIRNAWNMIKTISLSVWDSMVFEMKEMVKKVLPDFAVKAFFDVSKTQSEFKNSTFSVDNQAAPFAAMAAASQPGLWGAPLPMAAASPIQVSVTTNVNGTTIDEVTRTAATNARMANAATYRDTRKGVDY